jgi:hypothetical protein
LRARNSARPAGSLADQGAEVFDAEPGDGAAGVDGQLAEHFAQVRLARAGRPADAEVLVPVDPLEGAQRLLGGARDGTTLFVPDVEGLAGLPKIMSTRGAECGV